MAVPFSTSQSNPPRGFLAPAGSPAIQIMNGMNGSFASAEDLMSAVKIGPIGTSQEPRSTVRESETSCRAPTATANLTEGSGSAAMRSNRANLISDDCSPENRAIQARTAGSLSSAYFSSSSSDKVPAPCSVHSAANRVSKVLPPAKSRSKRGTIARSPL